MAMYNRYVPQGDGSFRRNTMAEPQPPRHPQQSRPPAPPEPECHAQESCQSPPVQPCQKSPLGIGSFLRGLLPKGFDTGDLLVVLLILLMAGDCQEDQNTALLTLALYFFL